MDRLSLMQRSKHSFCGKELRVALLKEQPCLQAEDLEECLRYYVGDELLQEIHNNSNHLICGRRGSGKTHFLRAFTEMINDNPQSRELVVMMSCGKFSLTPPTMVDQRVDYARAKYTRLIFQTFLRQFMNKLIINVGIYIDGKLSTQLKSKELKRLKHDSDDKLIKLLELTEIGVPLTVEATQDQTVQSEKSKEKAKSADIGFGVKLDQSNPHLSFRAGTGFGIKGNTEFIESQTRHIVSTLAIDIPQIRDTLSELLEILHIKTFHLLLDEWMELDKNLNLQIQPYFAQLLKLLLFNHRRFSVKIASVWDYTYLYDRDFMDKSKGIELGEDIFLGVDLDASLVGNQDEIISFFKNLLYKRLEPLAPKLDMFQKDSRVDDLFLLECFAGNETFTTFIAACHGIPRDFLETFQKCSLKIKREFQNYWITKDLVRDVARTTYLVEKRNLLQKSSSGQQLLKYTNDYLDKVESSIFLIAQEEAKSSIPLRKLVDEKLVHPIPSSATPRSFRDDFCMFRIDYGNYVDWYLDSFQDKKTDIEQTLEETINPSLPAEFVNNFQNYVLSIYGIGHETKRCHVCGGSFKIDEPVYAKLRHCPKCAENLENDSPTDS